MRILIMDDDKEFCTTLKEDLFHQMSVFNNRTEYHIVDDCFLDFKFTDKYDIAFIDIDLVKVNGIEIAKNLKREGLCRYIVFVTSHSHLVYDSFVVQPFFFIRKNEYKNDLLIFFDLIADSLNQGVFITLKWHGNKKTVNTDDIVYIEAINHTLIVHTTDSSYKDNRSLKNMLKDLNSDNFIQIYKSYVINLNYLVNFNNSSVELILDIKLNIGKMYKQHFLDGYARYLENAVI